MVGTPIGNRDLRITLLTSDDEAGPLDPRILVTDAADSPVGDAMVMITIRHLEMNMGEWSYEALATEPGVSVAEDIGMGGRWRIEVNVTRAGYPPVVVVFIVNLQELM